MINQRFLPDPWSKSPPGASQDMFTSVSPIEDTSRLVILEGGKMSPGRADFKIKLIGELSFVRLKDFPREPKKKKIQKIKKINSYLY